MIQIKKLKQQHDEIIKNITKLSLFLNDNDLINNSAKIIEYLKLIASSIKLHLVLEDKILYPELLKHDNPVIKKLAQKFIDEIGGLKKFFIDYINKWKTSDKIKSSPTIFKKESNNIFSALATRIKRENEELFPLCPPS